MFVDEKKAGEAQTKADPLSLESLIAWLEKQPEDGLYNYSNVKDCLICRYLRAAGIPFHSAGGEDFQPANIYAERVRLPGWRNVTAPSPHTFGAALSRARALQAK